MRWLVGLLLLTSPLQAQTAEEIARAASDQLERAAASLQVADGARDRVAALTETVRAFEQGLQALRDGLRRVAVRQRALEEDLSARDAEIGRLLAALQRMERSASPVLLMHPSGPVGTARSAMILADLTPVLQREADALRDDLDRLAALRETEKQATDRLERGLHGIEEARATLSDAIAGRDPLPPRVATEEARIADLLAQAETLDAFADGLGALPSLLGGRDLTLPLPPPVDGLVLRRFREPDAAGVARPGMVLATFEGALVAAPWAGTVRYAGPLLDYGNVIILEPEPEILFIFAGISDIYARVGEILEAESPLGLMGRASPDTVDFLRQARAGGSTSRSETLYIEVRQANRPMDPATWFAIE